MRRGFILFFVFIYSVFIFAKPLELELSAPNAILINADSGRILFEKDAHQQAYPASVTKMITIWYVLEKHSDDLNNFLTATEGALKIIDSNVKINSNYRLTPYILESDGTTFDIQINEKITLNDLLCGMSIISGNDASNVVAENLGGSIENFMRDINEYIKQKGFENTNLCNPHGLHFPSHVTTVYDVAYITKLALSNPKFSEILSCKYFVRPKTNLQQKKEIITRNKLFKPGVNYYKYTVCSKTGYHSKAKNNILTVAKKNDRTLIAVVFGCSTDSNRYEDTIKLFETAFSETKITKKIMNRGKIFLAKINGGSKNLKATSLEDLNIDYYPSEETQVQAQIIWENLKAPIKKGQRVGYIKLFVDENDVLKKQNIYALTDVNRSFFFMLKQLFVKK